jgi:hypothetical protein
MRAASKLFERPAVYPPKGIHDQDLSMSTHTRSSEVDKASWVLSSLDWRVWFLGYGIGGCSGLSLIAGIWSVVVDTTSIPGLIAITISAIHFIYLAMFWARRSSTLAKPAIRNGFLLGSAGIATVAFLLNANESRVPSANTLYALAFMSFVFAFVMPMQAKSEFFEAQR